MLLTYFPSRQSIFLPLLFLCSSLSKVKPSARNPRITKLGYRGKVFENHVYAEFICNCSCLIEGSISLCQWIDEIVKRVVIPDASTRRNFAIEAEDVITSEVWRKGLGEVSNNAVDKPCPSFILSFLSYYYQANIKMDIPIGTSLWRNAARKIGILRPDAL